MSTRARVQGSKSPPGGQGDPRSGVSRAENRLSGTERSARRNGCRLTTHRVEGAAGGEHGADGVAAIGAGDAGCEAAQLRQAGDLRIEIGDGRHREAGEPGEQEVAKGSR